MDLKHSYLIVAHSEPEILRVLVALLDDVRNDIYIHVDKKTDIGLFKNVETKFSKLHFLEERIDVRWGDISLVKVEFLLMKTARNKSNYAYYHIISGVDLPLHNQDYIHSFIESLGGDKEFVSIAADSDIGNKKDILHKTDQYWLFTDNIRRNGTIKSFVSNFLASVFVNIQRIIGIHRKYPFKIRKSCQWMSITGNLCDYILKNEESILKVFKYTLCPDEFAIQAFILNSEFNKKRYLPNEPSKSDMRLVDWERGTPYTWQTSDYKELLKSDKFFARKFSSADINIVYAIYKHVMEEKFNDKK